MSNIFDLTGSTPVSTCPSNFYHLEVESVDSDDEYRFELIYGTDG